MDTPSLALLAALAALGLAAGFLAGLFGIGGGMLLVPGLTFVLGAQAPTAAVVKVAIATSMASIVATSLSSVAAHHRRGAVRWDLVRRLVPGVLLGAAVGAAGLFRVLDGRWLALGFAGFLVLGARQMLRGAAPDARRQLPGRGALLAAGTAIGLLSALVGAGGGFIAVPLLAWWGVPLHAAVATSAAVGLPVALANTAGYAWAGASVSVALPGTWGWFHLPALACVAVASVPAAQLGARAAHALPVRTLRAGFAALLGVLAAYMLAKGLGA